MMKITVQEIVFDCADIERVASFWSRLLDRPWVRLGEEWLVVDLGTGVHLGFQPVPEAKTVKNRVHLDLEVDDPDAALDHALACGAELVEQGIIDDDGTGGHVLLDVEGNEFCLVWDLQGAYEAKLQAALKA